jgi:hypothetical protein
MKFWQPGKGPSQNFMQQMQQQQQRQRRRMEGYWWQQHQKKARTKKWQPDIPSLGRDNFAQAEAELAQLRKDVTAKRLTPQEFKARLQRLFVRDALGNLWMLNAQDGLWYRYNGTKWVRANPPGHGI